MITKEGKMAVTTSQYNDDSFTANKNNVTGKEAHKRSATYDPFIWRSEFVTPAMMSTIHPCIFLGKTFKRKKTYTQCIQSLITSSKHPQEQLLTKPCVLKLVKI
jgi:hypothetical protein